MLSISDEMFFLTSVIRWSKKSEAKSAPVVSSMGMLGKVLLEKFSMDVESDSAKVGLC